MTSTWGSARRARLANLQLWLAKWNTHGRCTHCHQPHGIPCLNLAPRSTDMYADEPHPGRLNLVEPT